MGLLKKMRSRPSLRSLYPRRSSKPKAAAAATEADAADIHDTQSWVVNVTSTPVAHSRTRSFNWLTNEVDDFECDLDYPSDETASSCQVTAKEGAVQPAADGQSTSVDQPTAGADDPDAGWAWLLMPSCCGSPDLTTNEADDLTYASSDDSTIQSSCKDDGSGDSSQHSESRINHLLKLARSDDVSDVTSAASIDDSGSDSDDSTSCSGEI